MNRLIQGAVIAAALVCGSQAVAHHSTANFDYTRTVVLDGRVKQLQWMNPHSFLQVLVPDGKGGTVEWSVEAGSPALARRLGWRPDMFKAGDPVHVTIAPIRTGEHGGTLRTVRLANGTVLNGPGAQGGALPPALALPTIERSGAKK